MSEINAKPMFLYAYIEDHMRELFFFQFNEFDGFLLN